MLQSRAVSSLVFPKRRRPGWGQPGFEMPPQGFFRSEARYWVPQVAVLRDLCLGAAKTHRSRSTCGTPILGVLPRWNAFKRLRELVIVSFRNSLGNPPV